MRAALPPSTWFAQRFDRLNLELALDQGVMRTHVTVAVKEGIWKTLTGGDEHDYAFAAGDLQTVIAGIWQLIQKHMAVG